MEGSFPGRQEGKANTSWFRKDRQRRKKAEGLVFLPRIGGGREVLNNQKGFGEISE